MLWKCCNQYASKFGKLRSHHMIWKGQFSFQSQRQCQRMFKLLHTSTLLTCKQSNLQNSPSQALTVCETWTSRCSNWLYKRQMKKISNFQHLLDYRKSKSFPGKQPFLLYWLCQSLCVNHNKLWKIFNEMGIPDHLTCILRDLYAGKEPRVRIWHETPDWFQIGKRVC